MICTLFLVGEITNRQRQRRRSFELCDCTVWIQITQPSLCSSTNEDCILTEPCDVDSAWSHIGHCDMHCAFLEEGALQDEEFVLSPEGLTLSVARLETRFPVCPIRLNSGSLPVATNAIHLQSTYFGAMSSSCAHFPPTLLPAHSPRYFSEANQSASVEKNGHRLWSTISVWCELQVDTPVATTFHMLQPTREAFERWMAIMNSQETREVVSNVMPTTTQRAITTIKLPVQSVCCIGADCCAAMSVRLSSTLRRGATLPLDWIRSTPKGIRSLFQHITATDSPMESLRGVFHEDSDTTVAVDHTVNTNAYFTNPSSQRNGSLWWDKEWGLIGSTEEVHAARRRWSRLPSLLLSTSGNRNDAASSLLLLLHVAKSVAHSNSLYPQVGGNHLGSGTEQAAWEDLVVAGRLASQSSKLPVMVTAVNLFAETFSIVEVASHQEKVVVTYMRHAHIAVDAVWERTARSVAEYLDTQFATD